MYVLSFVWRLALTSIALMACAAPAFAQNAWEIKGADDTARVIFLCVLLVAILFGLRRSTFGPARAVVMNIAVWLVLFVGLAVAYQHRDNLRVFALTALSDLRPGQPVALSEEKTVLARGRDGHFTALALINGQPVHLLVDTGASDIVLPFYEANRLGLNVEELEFTTPVRTANGGTHVASIMLNEVRIGDLTIRNVKTSVAEPGRLHGALLGMSFLGRLSKFSFEGDKLILER